MTITTAATGTPIPKANAAVRWIDENGYLTNAAVQLMNQWREFLVGMNRIIPCNASGTDLITLAPLDSAPLIEKYVDYEAFAFTAANTSTGSVTATVVPRKGTLDTLKVYKTDGASQATAGDVVANSVYLLLYADHLDSNNGGFVLK